MSKITSNCRWRGSSSICDKAEYTKKQTIVDLCNKCKTIKEAAEQEREKKRRQRTISRIKRSCKGPGFTAITICDKAAYAGLEVCSRCNWEARGQVVLDKIREDFKTGYPSWMCRPFWLKRFGNRQAMKDLCAKLAM